jgi:enhancer of mRNA-decapping protein 3
MTRKPSAAPVRSQVAQAIQPNALPLLPQPSFTLTTPTRTPATSVRSAMTRAGSIGLSRQASSQGSGVGLNDAPIPTGPRAVHSRASNAATENSRPSPATLQPPFATMSLRGDNAAESSAFDETDDASLAPPTPYNQRNKFAGKRARKGKGFAKKQPDQFLDPMQQEDSVVLKPGMFGGAVAQAAAASASAGRGFVQPGSKTRITRRRQKHGSGHCMSAEEEGWATEDVNDYKEREFDFQSNLDRFDKKSVFSQIKAEDNTADEARLVSFNRLPQRKPPPKKNYHPSENVLGNYANGKGLADRDGWPVPEFIAEQSEDSDDEDETRGRNAGAAESGRTSRRALSRRQSDSARRRQLSVGGRVSVEPLSSSGSAVLNKPVKPSFRLTPSNRPCPIVSPLQMLDVERIAEVELGLTDDMMTENAGRGVAQVAIQAFGKRISATNHNALPVVLVFAGNNKSGARAIAAGRHLKNHHVRVMVCVLGLEREDELLENVKRQLNIFRNAGGRVARWEELQNNLKQIDSPPELIIDGLLGMHLGFEDLRTDDQATAFELVQFANKSKASVLSVDVPSGIDGSSGVYSDFISPTPRY